MLQLLQMNKPTLNRFTEYIKRQPLWFKSACAALIFIISIIVVGIYADANLYNFTPDKSSQVFGRGMPDDPLSTFIRYDSFHYKNIATDGYTPGDAAFFPLYPLLVKGISYTTGISVSVSLFVVSAIFLIAATIVLLYWLRFELRLRKSQLSPWSIVGLLALFPTSFYVALGYSESLFIFLSVAALFAYRRGNYWIAAVTIALATATRVQGGALAIFFLVDYLSSRKWRDWKKLLPVIAAPIGIALYMTYLWMTFGNAFEFIAAQQNWGRLSGNIFENLATSFRPPYMWYLPVLAVMLWSVWKYLGKTWFIYCLVFILIPLSSGRLDSLNRYMIALPPLFLALSLYLETKPPYIRLSYIVTSVFLLAWNILLFTNDYWVA